MRTLLPLNKTARGKSDPVFRFSLIQEENSVASHNDSSPGQTHQSARNRLSYPYNFTHSWGLVDWTTKRKGLIWNPVASSPDEFFFAAKGRNAQLHRLTLPCDTTKSWLKVVQTSLHTQSIPTFFISLYVSSDYKVDYLILRLLRRYDLSKPEQHNS